MTHRYILSLGTNMEPREERLRQAMCMLSEIDGNCVLSTPYATASIGKDAGNERKHYRNAVAVVETEMDSVALGEMLKEYERRCGRTAAMKAEGIVPIDIDIVMADDAIVRQKDFNRYYFRQGYEELQSILGEG